MFLFQDERDRIEAQGGFVMLMGELWRVGGNLAVSRAIGIKLNPETVIMIATLVTLADWIKHLCLLIWG